MCHIQGDQTYKWRMDEFRMFRGGSYWKPPPMNPYTQGMPDELVDVSDLDIDVTLESNIKDRNDDVEPSQRGKLTDR